jgi:tetratricopeptide (TPR) repeat protein
MIRGLLAPVFFAALACAWFGSAAFAGQSPLADAQYDYNAGRYNRAVDTLTGAIARAPEDAALQFLLGETYYQLREFPRAITSLERATQLSPKDSEYHDWLGRSYGRRAEETMFLGAMGWARKTHHEFEIAVELDPRNFEAQRDLIRFEMNAPAVVGGGDDKAVKHIADLEKIDHIQGLLARGEFLETRKRWPDADKVFDDILLSDSDRAGVYFEVGDYYRDRPDGDKMRQAIDKAQRLSPDDRRLKFYNGVLLVMMKKNPAEAEAMLKSYIATVPDNSDLPPHAIAYEWLGKLYESLGRHSEATEQYRIALSLDPHDRLLEEELKRAEKK